MVANTLIVELGEKIVKVCVSAKKSKKFQILDSFMFQTPERCVADGQLIDQEVMAVALKEQMAANAVQDVKKIIFILNSSKVATREITIPLVKENRIKSIIETNAEEYFPVELSNYKLAFNILERMKGENAGYRVLLYAVPRILINSYIRLAELLGLPIEAIDYCGNSQYQVLHQIHQEGVVMYIDINMTNTYVNFMENGVLLLQRNLGFGGDYLLTTVLEKEGRGTEDYLSVLQQLSDEGYMDQTLPMRDRKMALNRLAFNVLRMIEFFRSNYKEKDISNIVIMGTCSNVAGLPELIKTDTGLDTIHIYELEEMKKLADSEEGLTFYLSCFGSLIAPLDLLPEDYTARTKKKKDGGDLRGAQIICLTCVCAGIIMCAYGAYRNNLWSEKVTDARLETIKMKEVKKIYSAYEEYQEIYDKLQVMKGLQVTPNANLIKFLAELEEKMPHDLTLLSLECTNESVVMNITTPGFAEAAVTLAQLRTFTSLESISVSGLSKSVGENGDEKVSFNIRCVYGEIPADDETAQDSQGQ